MKTDTYKKTDNGIEKIGNDFNKLNDNNPLTVLLAEYEDLFHKIQYGSNVTNFVRTKEYKEGLQDSLQWTMAEILESKVYEKHDNIPALLKTVFYKRTMNNMRNENTYKIFIEDFSEYVQSKNYGVTKEYLSEIMVEVKKALSVSQYEIFELYHLKDYSIEDIRDKRNMTFYSVQSQVRAINNKLDKLKVVHFFDTRYTSYNSPKKKRQHKRKVMTWKEYQELSGNTYQINEVDYIPTEKLITNNNGSKGYSTSKLPYSIAQSRKDIALDHTVKTQICNEVEVMKQDKAFLTGIYSDSYLPYEKPKHIKQRMNKYQSKKFKRIYIRQHGIEKYREYMSRDVYKD